MMSTSNAEHLETNGKVKVRRSSRDRKVRKLEPWNDTPGSDEGWLLVALLQNLLLFLCTSLSLCLRVTHKTKITYL